MSEIIDHIQQVVKTSNKKIKVSCVKVDVRNQGKEDTGELAKHEAVYLNKTILYYIEKK